MKLNKEFLREGRGKAYGRKNKRTIDSINHRLAKGINEEKPGKDRGITIREGRKNSALDFITSRQGGGDYEEANQNKYYLFKKSRPLL